VVDHRAELWALVVADAGDSSQWVAAVCAVAVRRARVDGAAVSLRSGSSQELVASIGALAVQLEELQYTLGEGPGVEAFNSGGPVLVSDLVEEDGRWPGFTMTAADAGLGAVFAFPLRAGATRLGVLELYRERPRPLSSHELLDATLLAELAVTALLDPQNAAPSEVSLFEGHYDQVNVAIGMVAVQLRISVSDASARLRAYAFSHGIPLLELATDIVNNRVHLDEPSE
jgi:GAF domain-containing protein